MQEKIKKIIIVLIQLAILYGLFWYMGQYVALSKTNTALEGYVAKYNRCENEKKTLENEIRTLKFR
jgi:cell division protein FtsB